MKTTKNMNTNSKFLNFLFIIFVMILFFNILGFIGCTPTQQSSPPQETRLPDLIINSISYRIIPPNDSLGRPMLLPDIAYIEFKIEIKNIGDVSFANAFYIANTKSNPDLTHDYYSHVQRVNQEKRKLNPNEIFEVKLIETIDLNPNEQFEVAVLTAIDFEVDRVRFLIASDSENSQKGKLPELFPEIKEKDYQNNMYELLIKEEFHK